VLPATATGMMEGVGNSQTILSNSLKIKAKSIENYKAWFCIILLLIKNIKTNFFAITNKLNYHCFTKMFRMECKYLLRFYTLALSIKILDLFTLRAFIKQLICSILHSDGHTYISLL